MHFFTSEFIFGHLNYWLFVILMMTGLYIVIGKGNLVKKNCRFEYISNFSLYVLYFNGKSFWGHRPNFSLRWQI